MDESKKAKLQRKAIVALLVVFALILFYNYRRNAKQASMPKSPGVLAGEFNIEAAVSNMENIMRKKVAYQGEPYRDPLEKPLEISMLEKEGAKPVSVIEPTLQEGKVPEQEFVLEGIIWGADGKIAIISGEVVTEGETIKTAKVETITEEKVILDKNGKKIELMR